MYFQLFAIRMHLMKIWNIFGRRPSMRRLTAHADRFPKGAMLFALWYEMPYRATRDIDLVGFGPSDLDSIYYPSLRSVLVPALDDAKEIDRQDPVRSA